MAAICASLDGLPLALELAAGQADTLSAAAIRDRLCDRFTLLVDGGRDASARQQTLRATIEWSFNLLRSDERRLFVRLSVFAGRFGLDEMVPVAGPDLPDPVRLLGGLVRQSMVTVAGQDQYRLLDSLRQFGRELLADDPEAHAVHERHARVCVEATTVAGEGIWSARRPTHVEHVRDALPNVRAAIAWCLEHDEQELAARMVASLSWFFMLEGMFSEGLAYCERLDRASDQLSRTTRARLAYTAGLLSAPLGRLEEVGSGWIINWRPEPPVTFNEAADADLERGERFRHAMLDAGVLLPPYVITDCRLNLAFSDDDVDETVAAARRAFRLVA